MSSINHRWYNLYNSHPKEKQSRYFLESYLEDAYNVFSGKRPRLGPSTSPHNASSCWILRGRRNLLHLSNVQHLNKEQGHRWNRHKCHWSKLRCREEFNEIFCDRIFMRVSNNWRVNILFESVLFDLDILRRDSKLCFCLVTQAICATEIYGAQIVHIDNVS